ncbi:hypothetical protein [Legionella yabuuchiae]|uniref:hypothetical protein n=1 Tax=Legionella yabuuchiae TaxID=376727 RepID=UPI0010560214|nr:hypothetical protein [Legionella yabuuchiae]
MPTGIDETEKILQAATVLSNHSDLWIAIGKKIYQKLTERKPLSNHSTDVYRQDLKRYNRMVQLYKEKLHKPNCPVQWELDEKNCPTWHCRLDEFITQYKTEAEALRASDFPLKFIPIKITASISRLFESLQKRSQLSSLPKYKYRTDGYEAMFFSELIQWLCVDLARLDITEQNTADEVLKRIKYCEAIESEVFVYRDDTDKANPKNKLQRTIENLKYIHKNCLKAIEAVSFNKCIESIDKDFREMIVCAFDICHLILKNVNQEELQVDEFLRPMEVDQKVKSLLGTTLGQWIKNTLETAGIVSNDFESNKEVSLEVIVNYLNIDFNTLDLKKSGLLSFGKQDATKAPELLKKIANIHRAILNLCHVRASLVKSSCVSAKLGENWLYGNDEGKAVIQALLIAVNDASQNFNNEVKSFWDMFYTKGYKKYADEKKKDAKDVTFKRIEIAKKRYDLIEEKTKKVKENLETIRNSIKDFHIDSAITEQKKRDLISALYAYLQRMPNPDQDVLKAIKRLFEKDNTALDTVQAGTSHAIPESIKPYIVKFPINKIPIYKSARNRLFGYENENFAQDLTMMPKPVRFYTKVQERLYNEFLVPYNALVNSFAIFSIFYPTLYTVGLANMEALRKIYSDFNTIMKVLYKPCDSIEGYSLSMEDEEASSYQDKKLYLTINDNKIEYKVRQFTTGELCHGSIDIHDLDPEFSMPVTFDKLQTYLLDILCITMKNGHTVAEREISEASIDGDDEVFYQLRKNSVQQAAFFWEIQLKLIDVTCKMALHRFSTNCKVNPFNMLASEDDLSSLRVQPRDVNDVDESIEITIDKSLLSYAGGAFADELQDLRGRLEKENREHATLAIEHAKTLAELDAAKAIISQKMALITKHDDTVAELQATIHDRDEALRDRDEALRDKEKAMREDQELIESLKAKLAAKDETAATQTEVMNKLMLEVIKLRDQLPDQAPPPPNPYGFF